MLGTAPLPVTVYIKGSIKGCSNNIIIIIQLLLRGGGGDTESRLVDVWMIGFSVQAVGFNYPKM